MPKKLKSVGFRVPTVNPSKVKPLNRETSGARTVTGHALQRRNARLMLRNPWCVECERLGERVLVVEFDHIIEIEDGGPDTDENLQGLCLPHHREKSARSQRARLGLTCEPA